MIFPATTTSENSQANQSPKTSNASRKKRE